MKKLWWLIVGVAAIFLYFWWKKQAATSAAATKAAGTGITSNPLTDFWGGSFLQSAANSSTATKNAFATAGNLFSGVKSLFGGNSQGKNSPTTAGSGSGGPTDAQLAAASGVDSSGNATNYDPNSGYGYADSGSDFGGDATSYADDWGG